MLRVRLLGGLALEGGGRPLDAPASRRARELLAWLALHPGRTRASSRAALLARRARIQRPREPAHDPARAAPRARRRATPPRATASTSG